MGDARFEQTVDAEGERHTQTRPRYLAVDEAHHQHRNTGNRDGHPLSGAQALLQENHAQHHGDQRVNEIAQGHVNRVAAGRCHHVDKPVRADEERCRRQHQHDTAIFESAAEVSGCPQNR